MAVPFAQLITEKISLISIAIKTNSFVRFRDSFRAANEFYVCLTVKIAVDASSKLKFASLRVDSPSRTYARFCSNRKGVNNDPRACVSRR